MYLIGGIQGSTCREGVRKGTKVGVSLGRSGGKVTAPHSALVLEPVAVVEVVA